MASLVDAGMNQFLKKRIHRGKTFCKICISGWQGRRDSNSQPLVLETSALPIELHPCMLAHDSRPPGHHPNAWVALLAFSARALTAAAR